jgi:RNA polymerase sigma-70 factor (ECF subfamily)
MIGHVSSPLVLKAWSVLKHDSVTFAEFYEGARDDCLRAVFASVDDRQAAEDLVAEAFARAWAHWRSVSRPC